VNAWLKPQDQSEKRHESVGPMYTKLVRLTQAAKRCWVDGSGDASVGDVELVVSCGDGREGMEMMVEDGDAAAM